MSSSPSASVASMVNGSIPLESSSTKTLRMALGTTGAALTRTETSIGMDSMTPSVTEYWNVTYGAPLGPAGS